MRRRHEPRPFEVRPACAEDARAVTDVLRASYSTLMRPHYDPAVIDGALPLICRANPALLGSGRYFVAAVPGSALAGCGGWSLERPGTGEREPGLGHVRHFGTHPDWARRGVARAIYRRCESAARAAGVERLECYASLGSEAFYAALGFEPAGPVEVILPGGLGLPGTLMERPLGG